MKTTRLSFHAVGLLAVVACGGSSKPGDARYPARPEGCDVKIFHDAPTMQTDNLGPVRARCSEDVPEDDCLRTLKDEVCKLGGDIVWGVPETPEKANGKIRWSGRAAHTRAH